MYVLYVMYVWGRMCEGVCAGPYVCGPYVWGLIQQKHLCAGRKGALFRFWGGVPEGRSVLLGYATLFDAGLLAGEGAEVVELGATYLTVLVDGDGVDER